MRTRVPSGVQDIRIRPWRSHPRNADAPCGDPLSLPAVLCTQPAPGSPCSAGHASGQANNTGPLHMILQ